MEPSRQARHWFSAANVAGHRSDRGRGSRVDQAAVLVGPRSDSRRVVLAARPLQLDRRLPLVVDRGADPHSAATASNSRPMLLVAASADRRVRPAAPPPARPRVALVPISAAGSALGPAAASQAHAIRQGSRTARSPPGSRTAAGADPLESREVADQQLATPDGAVAAVARRRRRSRRPPVRPHRARPAGGQVGVVVLNADRADAVALERVPGRQVLRVEVVRHDLGRAPRTAARSGRSPR